MSEAKGRIIQLIEEYLTGEIDDSRKTELMNWVNEQEGNRLFFERVTKSTILKQRWVQWKEIDPEAAKRLFDRRIRFCTKRKAVQRWWIYAAAAAMVVLIVGISFRQLNNLPEEKQAKVATILPGSDKAILILANGEEMDLEESDSLQISLGDGHQLINRNKQLVYQGETADELQYNELRIPRGGEYQVKLADGTVVRLNSGSSLKYPVAFGKDKREIELVGEAYFEVAKEKTPFFVKVGELVVKVYGTKFNINSHRQNRIQTALVDGKVGILLQGQEYLMSPSQLADFNSISGTLDIYTTDLNPYLAWTKGLFIFNNQTLEEIMTTLSLWYDVEVFYQNPSLQELHFTGYVKRYDSIDNILKALSQSVGVKINQQGKTLTISY